MRILLVGEYSNLHNSLKAGLENLGHTVTLMSTGDAFKDYPSDVKLKAKRITGYSLLNFYRKALYRLTKFDIATLEIGYRALDYLVDQKPYDVIQLINEYPLKTPYFIERRIIEQLRQLTPKLVILACGDDLIYLSNLNKLKHHPILQHPEIEFPYSEQYISLSHKKYHDFIFKLKDLIISTDFDYHPAYTNVDDYYGLIPNPIHLEKLVALPLPKPNPIVIFHGINQVNYYKKGNNYFEAALEIIQNKYPNRVQVVSVSNIPYAEYINAYDNAHIILDQTYAEDQGYNALEAMAKGKVVFTGAGELFTKHYKLAKNSVAIHTIPDAEIIADDLEQLILNPSLITEIGLNARKFIEEYHDSTAIAKQYIKAWETAKPKTDAVSA
ncbi:glycosyltransferase [Leeuwenhoekiella sp. MAR_2009_132]|uniref:glycosyltransferase n=1 Tax=Leeuwenhoekiella sp. MAR_2009_132 TaxID=1392489 RepID=UPI00048D0470|nr:glycosyltransferase [Leeuwenhoekiella sp. MAR_2009_132]